MDVPHASLKGQDDPLWEKVEKSMLSEHGR
jgi:hypothetical protein